MRWGLVELSHYCMSLPGGAEALRRINKEGETPGELAIRNGHNRLVDLLRNFQDIPPLSFCSAAINPDSFLRFCRSSGVLTLSRRQTSGDSLESDIELFRRCLCDTTFFEKIVSPVLCWNHKNQMQVDGSTSEAEKRHSSVDVLKRLKYPPTMIAAARLTAMLNGTDEVYANSMVVDEVNNSEINFSHLENAGCEVSYTDQSDPALTPESSVRAASLSTCASPENSRAEANNADSAHPPAYTLPSRLSTPAGNSRQCRTLGYSTDRNAVFAAYKKRSSSLDGLDADSDGEESYSRYDNSASSAKEDSSGHLGNSGDELDSPETNPDYQMRQVGTLPFAQSKDPLASGLRFRSYSYSSPKNSLGKPRLTRDLSIGEPGDERAYSLPEQSREKRIEEEEWDRYMTPAKPEAEKNKVSRTFSFLRSRMSSTRNKTKTKNKDSKEKVNRHQFVLGTYSGVVPCLVCEKALLGKESFQCSNCNVNVHKACKDAAPACAKKYPDRYNSKHKSAVPSYSSFKEIPQPILSPLPPSTSVSVGFTAGKKEAGQSAHLVTRSMPVATLDRRLDQSLESDGDTSGTRSRSQSEELLQTMGTSPSLDAFPIEDVVDAVLWNYFSSDAMEFEAESWTLVVDPSFCSKQEKDVIKRQDVIYELMQTELHHIQTLFIMSEIFRKGMKEELQLDHSTVDRIFPCLDELLESHKSFFYNLRERKQESREGNDRNFVINRIGDILIQQFSAENAEKMKRIYGEFCSHHIEAVNLFKELQQNKKFQNFIKVTNTNLQARRRGIPECILLVTQRITKYPVLVERILRCTPEGSEEHKDLCRALGLIKDMLASVDLKVSEFERKQRLEEFVNKLENKTFTKMKNGHVFTKQDLKNTERVLLHEGVLLWKTATGRFKDIQALLLTDVLLFLQEKDQKYIFAAVDQKSPVISLQKLIVREVANEERGMFLISASSAGPEMYEIHTNSKEERNSWMRQIQEAVQSCPEENEEGKMNESDEGKRAAEARTAKAQEYQEVLTIHDQQICSYLEEKLQIFAEFAALCGTGDMKLETQLLVKADSGEIPPAASLLEAALKETERLYMILASQMESPAWPSEDLENSDRSRGYSSMEPVEESQEIQYNCQSPELRDDDSCFVDASTSLGTSDADMSSPEERVELNHTVSRTPEEVLQTVQNLTRLLYSIQGSVAIQDSQIELSKVLNQEQDSGGKGSALRGTHLQEQYRYLEKHHGEVAKLQQQFQQEQHRWARECEQKEKELEEKENMIQQWERDWQCQVRLLEEKKDELTQQLLEFQQNVQRLKEGQRLVEKEREDLCVQHKLLRHWKHTRQNSLPVFPHHKTEGVRNPQPDSLQLEDSGCLNNALAQISLNNMAPQRSSAYSDAYADHTSDCVETFGSSPVDISSEPWSALISRQHRPESSSRHSNKDACNNDLNAASVIYCGTLLSSGSQNAGSPLSPRSDTTNALHTDTPNSIENGRIEENIIYL
ncbi:rho guanine nucleotide exchange factor 28 isoform X2 [Hyperolius riggenbachi]